MPEGSEVISLIQQGSGKGMPNHVRMNPFLDQSLFRQRFDEAINSLWGKWFFFIGAMFSQGVEYRMVRVTPIPICFQIILDGDKGFSFQRDSSVFLFSRVGPSQAIDIVNEGQINGTFLGLRIAFSYLKSCS